MTVPRICPAQLTDVESQVPVTSPPDWARTIPSWSVGLLLDAIVPFHVPAMFVVVPADTADGAVELAQAATVTTRQTISARRIIPSVTVNSVSPLTVL